MIGKTYRFHGLGSLRLVYRDGRSVRAAPLAIKYLLNTRRQDYRLAVVVSKKVSKSAVVRNRIRRRVMEVVRLQAHDIIKPYDIVVTVYQDTVAAMPANELNKMIQNLLQQANIIS